MVIARAVSGLGGHEWHGGIKKLSEREGARGGERDRERRLAARRAKAGKNWRSGGRSSREFARAAREDI